jgi:hypothetical protein
VIVIWNSEAGIYNFQIVIYNFETVTCDFAWVSLLPLIVGSGTRQLLYEEFLLIFWHFSCCFTCSCTMTISPTVKIL